MTQPTIIDYPIPWMKRDEDGQPRERRDQIRGALIHSMGQYIMVGEQPYTAAEFLKRSPELTGASYSAHCLVEPDGTIVRCIPDNREAFHAGQSEWYASVDDKLTRLRWLNRSFLGAEFLLIGEWSYGAFVEEMKNGNAGYTDHQYDSGGWLCATWMLQYNIPRKLILSHSTVASDKVRGKGLGKHDPGVGFHHRRLSVNINRWLKELRNGPRDGNNDRQRNDGGEAAP